MKCQICQQNDATIHFKQAVDGEVRELNVCQACAAKNGFDMQSPVALTDFLFGVGAPDAEDADVLDKTCPACGLTLAAFRKGGRVGCARCYDAFAEELAPMLQDMHRAGKHVGKVPVCQRLSAEVDALQKALERAVAGEDFEEAAALRDRIRGLRTRPAGTAAAPVRSALVEGAP